MHSPMAMGRTTSCSTSIASVVCASTQTACSSGWDLGPAVVDVERLGGRIVSLREQRSGRTVEIAWTDPGADAPLVAEASSSDGRSVAYRRDGNGRIVERHAPGGVQSYEWDGGMLLSVVDADGVAAFVNVYDEVGRVMQQTSPFGRVTSYRYEFPGATVIADERRVRQAMVHDGRGNLTAVIDVDGSAMRITYDDSDRAVRVVAKWRRRMAIRLRRRTPATCCAATIPMACSRRGRGTSQGRVLTDTDRAGATTTFEYAATIAPRRGRRPRRARWRRPSSTRQVSRSS